MPNNLFLRTSLAWLWLDWYFRLLFCADLEGSLGLTGRLMRWVLERILRKGWLLLLRCKWRRLLLRCEWDRAYFLWLRLAFLPLIWTWVLLRRRIKHNLLRFLLRFESTITEEVRTAFLSFASFYFRLSNFRCVKLAEKTSFLALITLKDVCFDRLWFFLPSHHEITWLITADACEQWLLNFLVILWYGWHAPRYLWFVSRGKERVVRFWLFFYKLFLIRFRWL